MVWGGVDDGVPRDAGVERRGISHTIFIEAYSANSWLVECLRASDQIARSLGAGTFDDGKADIAHRFSDGFAGEACQQHARRFFADVA